MEKLTLQGKKSSLIVEADVHHHSWVGGTSEAGDSYRSETCWKGKGKLTIGDNEKLFEFRTQIHREIQTDKLPPLEQELLVLHMPYNDSRIPTILQKEEIVDVMSEKIRILIEGEEGKGQFLIMESIVIPYLETFELANKGFVAIQDHQMELFAA